MTEKVDWDEIEPLAAVTFDIFDGQPEMRWAGLAWRHLDRAGLTAGTTCLDVARSHVRMLVLASLYRDWCMKAWDEVQDDEVGYWIGEFDFLPLGVGQLIGVDDDLSTDPHEALVEALETLMARERKAVVDALLSGFGGVDGLFVALWRSNQDSDAESTDSPANSERAESAEQASLFDGEDENDLDDDDGVDEPETDADILNDVTASKMNAYEWVRSGCESFGPTRFWSDEQPWGR